MEMNGFDEAAGNFQKSNFGKGGKGNDQINVLFHSSTSDDDGFTFSSSSEDGISAEIQASLDSRLFVFDNTIMVSSEYGFQN
jgi:hypothetical protein